MTMRPNLNWSRPFFGIAAILAAFASTGCSSTKNNAPVIINPMPEIWARIEREIQGLKAGRSTYSQWKAAASVSGLPEPVTSIDRLRSVFAATGKPANDALAQQHEKELIERFLSAPRTVHFGFECDFHAIVFFDKHGHQIDAYP